MFDSDERHGCLSAIGLYGLQFVLVYPLTILLGLPLEPLFSFWGMNSDQPGGVTFAGFHAVIYLYVAACLGWFAGNRLPSLIPTGRWLWPLPVVVVSWDVLRALSSNGPSSRLYEYLYATGSNEGLVVVLFTLPRFAAIGYSVGMTLESWIREGDKEEGVPRRAVAAIALAAAFLVTTAIAQTVGNRMVQRDLSVRVAVGGPLAVDGTRLCEAQAAANDSRPVHGRLTIATGDLGRTIEVENGARLEVLEEFHCTDGRPVHVDAAAPGNTWQSESSAIERVRVLDGVNQGKEAWIADFQAWRPL
jgi:hypothetical protein